MKKYSWIVALLMALSLAFVFVGCGGDSDDPPPKNLPPHEIGAAEIVLEAVGSSKKPTVTGNKVAYDGSEAGVTGSGFVYAFPDDLEDGYTTIKIEAKLISIDSPDFVSFNAKDSTQISTDVLIVGHNQQYHGELKFGTIIDKAAGEACSKDCLKYTADTCIVGATAVAEYPLNKLKNKVIAFQYNPWAGDIGTAGWEADKGKPKFEIEVTKITFLSSAYEEPEPAPPAEPAPDEEFNAATGYTGITNEWGTTGSIVYTDGIISRAPGGSSLFGIKWPAAIDGKIDGEEDTIVITYIAILTAGDTNSTLELTVKQLTGIDGSNKNFGDITSGQYITLDKSGVEKTLEIPAVRYDKYETFANDDNEYLYFQDNSKGDETEWKLKIISVTLK